MFLENSTLDLILRGLVLGMIALAFVVVQIRFVGLRSLSKMTSFDFVMTVALGSLIAGAAQASEWTGFAQAMLAMVGIFVFQFIVALVRKRSDTVEDALANEPKLLMRDGEVLHEVLATTRVTEEDLRAKLRESNVLDKGQVRAVVLESTGDISVLHGDHLADEMLKDVADRDN
ncbi:DUF421 domain-containing protein [Aurantiacibacter sediminis]|uniref:DUF421 domain-containing protein n=1 Tax=Aurantiacibacter sediminis TaxID=2793064 RepID=A0ABS0N599_9SPHN|nr:YetF domain-containing protein [Aurantiacibacter sediminis]MBH5322960.1 DUF421 domain-containing protein [Aurantiacibacter sediminis]